jgi:hypothetical protein
MVVFDFRRCFTAVAIIPLLSQIQAIKTNTPIEIAPVPLQSAPLVVVVVRDERRPSSLLSGGIGGLGLGLVVVVGIGILVVD